MNFASLAKGDSVFLDANTLVYHFAPHPVFGMSCGDLLVRNLRQELACYTSTHVVGEMAHRLMTLEAMKTHGWPVAGIAQRLRKKPTVVQKLTSYRKAIQELSTFGIRILTISPNLLDTGAAVSQSVGLLTNDALIVAVMQANGLTNLASSDADFDRVPGITRFSPI